MVRNLPEIWQTVYSDSKNFLPIWKIIQSQNGYKTWSYPKTSA